MDWDGAPREWRKSTFSGNGDCVEWLVAGEDIYVRSSKHPSDAVLMFTRSEWLAFVAGVKAGQAEPYVTNRMPTQRASPPARNNLR
ncbi:MAG: DUF397 domain-containing protein [Acidobacteria bacterium]|nr:DUF397 domain-containing protein [Acidobacteriota bacterium]